LRAEIDAVKLDTVLVAPRLVAERGLGPALAGLETVDVESAEARLAPGLGLALRLRFGPTARLVGRDLDRVAAVVLSQQAPDGRRRGVELTHHNIRSNMESLKQVFRISRDDRILGLLPFANAFGLFGTLLLPAVVGVPVVLDDDPADLETLARLSREHGVTLLPVPGEQLEQLIERLSQDDLRTLRYVVVRAGSLAPETAARFADKFGIEPLEGLGCPECAPLISLNAPNVVAEARGQTAQRTGTAGQPLPGIAVRIVDAEGRDLEPGVRGSLLVSGPNVMRGYVDDPQRTREVLRDGWFHTGFYATLDEDGFLTVER
jgi:acyl-[acyl-carrier-protein]-phospholipid O-acyltransferase / long-chain-fatty-acid--[acyl-carrier-protein] ligase